MLAKKEKKYLEVKAGEVRKSVYETRREASFNDFENVRYHIGYATIDSVFNDNEVPAEYQKLFFKINGHLPKNILLKKRIMEFFSETFWELSTIKNEYDGEKIYCGKTDLSSPIESLFFTKDLNVVDNSELLRFLAELQSQGLLDNYLRSVLLFFADEFSKDYVDLSVDDLKLTLELPQK